MSDILVLGGGFAGVWAAAGAVRARRAAGVPEADLRVTLVSAGDDMVIRPRMGEPIGTRLGSTARSQVIRSRARATSTAATIGSTASRMPIRITSR